MSDELLTVEELAERLSVSPRTVIDWARRRIIPDVRPTPRVRRFDYDDVLRALKARPACQDGKGVPDGR